MFDVGNTLVRESDFHLFPHVIEALSAIDALKTESGEAPMRCLVSNFPATLPVPADRLVATLQDFLHLLPPALTAMFVPAETKVTLSAHAGVAKPDKKVFTTAVARLGLHAGLDECLLITEQHDHVVRCKQLGMSALQFGGNASPPPLGSDFTDWSEAPALIAHRLAPAGPANVEAAVRARLAATHPQLENVQLEPPGEGGAYPFKARAVVPLDDPALGELSGVHVDLNVSGTAQLDESGRLTAVEGTEPDPEELAEAKHMVKGLAATGQVATRQGPPALGATHEVLVDDQGRRRLKRTRFSAF
jgi:hypothetical protein